MYCESIACPPHALGSSLLLVLIGVLKRLECSELVAHLKGSLRMRSSTLWHTSRKGIVAGGQQHLGSLPVPINYRIYSERLDALLGRGHLVLLLQDVLGHDLLLEVLLLDAAL